MILPYHALLVFIGSGVGGVLRFLLSILQTKLYITFPIATIVVNVIGSIIILLFSKITTILFGENYYVSYELRLFITTGILGGFTTFSTMILDINNIIQNSGIVIASIYIIITIIPVVILLNYCR